MEKSENTKKAIDKFNKKYAKSNDETHFGLFDYITIEDHDYNDDYLCVCAYADTGTSMYDIVCFLHYILSDVKFGDIKIGSICLPNLKKVDLEQFHRYMLDDKEYYYDKYAEYFDMWYVRITFEILPI